MDEKIREALRREDYLTASVLQYRASGQVYIHVTPKDGGPIYWELAECAYVEGQLAVTASPKFPKSEKARWNVTYTPSGKRVNLLSQDVNTTIGRVVRLNQSINWSLSFAELEKCLPLICSILDEDWEDIRANKTAYGTYAGD